MDRPKEITITIQGMPGILTASVQSIDTSQVTLTAVQALDIWKKLDQNHANLYRLAVYEKMQPHQGSEHC